MAHMVMLIVSSADEADDVLEAWLDLGIDEALVLDSACFHRAARRLPHIPLRYGFEGPGDATRQCSVTLYCVVADEPAVERCIAAAESVVGDVDVSDTVMLAAWPLSVVKGFFKKRSEASPT